MGCREEILETIRREGFSEFSPLDVIDAMARHGTIYEPETIRTHVCTRMCVDVRNHRRVSFDDLVRVGRGRYKLRQ